jgi:hypothetical protein
VADAHAIGRAQPALALGLRLGAPLLAQEASYLAASARMLSLSMICMAKTRYWLCVQYRVYGAQGAKRDQKIAARQLIQGLSRAENYQVYAITVELPQAAIF